MSKEPCIAIIVEGEDREPVVLDNMVKTYFKHTEFRIINLPAGRNIYMLWQKLKEDEFETDIIEVLREYGGIAEKKLEGLERDDFSEIYLLFDYDNHQDNLHGDIDPKDVIEEMLQVFNNENEFGKLYINYPMIEALRDLELDYCSAKTNCFYKKELLKDYKKETAQNNNDLEQLGQYKIDKWKKIVDGFAMRVSCLFDYADVISYEQYSQKVSSVTIYDRQKKYTSKCFVLSAVPQFIIDYFGYKVWASHVKHKRVSPGSSCSKQ